MSKGEKLNFIIAKKLEEKNLREIFITNEELIGKYSSKELMDKNNNIILASGSDLNDETIEKIKNEGIKNLELVNIDPINKGPYLLETLKIDKNSNKTEALNDIYKVLRPGEAPTIEIAEDVFKNLYFNKDRYDYQKLEELS